MWEWRNFLATGRNVAAAFLGSGYLRDGGAPVFSVALSTPLPRPPFPTKSTHTMAKLFPLDTLPWATDKRERGAGAPRVGHPVVFTVLLNQPFSPPSPPSQATYFYYLLNSVLIPPVCLRRSFQVSVRLQRLSANSDYAPLQPSRACARLCRASLWMGTSGGQSSGCWRLLAVRSLTSERLSKQLAPGVNHQA